MENKQGHFYFDLLTLEEQEQFQINYSLERNFKKYLEEFHYNFQHFLSAFEWYDSPEGGEYWFLISKRTYNL